MAPVIAGEPGPEHEQPGGQRQQTCGVELVEEGPRQGQQRKAAYPAWPHLTALRVELFEGKAKEKSRPRSKRKLTKGWEIVITQPWSVGAGASGGGDQRQDRPRAGWAPESNRSIGQLSPSR